MFAASQQRKVLLMGKGGSGKTSMRSIIFANYQARDTRRLKPTFGAEQSYVRFLNMVLNIWDCGGQGTYVSKYLTTAEDNIFRATEVLIYVFDIQFRDDASDLLYYRQCLDSLDPGSNVRVFCLVHKMDLVPHDERDPLFKIKEAEIIKTSTGFSCTCFPTSIWDESLYNAWSRIVYLLIPNIETIERKLYKLAAVLEADEILLFEKATFLVISSRVIKPHPDEHRFEKISNIVKQFKLSCGKMATTFDGIEIANTRFVAFIEDFTVDTYVMVMTSDPNAAGVIRHNIASAKRFFNKMDSS